MGDELKQIMAWCYHTVDYLQYSGQQHEKYLNGMLRYQSVEKCQSHGQQTNVPRI